MKMTNKKMAKLLRDVAGEVEKIGSTSQIERLKRKKQLRRLEPIFKQEFVMSNQEARRLYYEAAVKGWNEGYKESHPDT
jgi:uncharacterized protein with von Willebrand factor type A (vWA) domain